ncbi:MAG: hypothetical protein SFW65_05560, partial [Alphaproteobacteria bacterium]|nr:hypothetical protein [Alphaproteobacteria bacterium]
PSPLRFSSGNNLEPMGLLLHLNMSGVKTLPLKPGFPRQYPYTQMVSRVLIDQIDPFHYSAGCEPISDILKMPSTNKSFGDVAEEHAVAMKKCDGNIYIMYSGGIDSSSAVIAFLRTWSAQELQRVYILSSHHSALEFPELWNVVVDKFKGRILPSFRHVEYYLKKGYIVTGEHGDQLFGSDVIRAIWHTYGDGGIFKPWQEIMPPVYRSMFGPEITASFIPRYEQTLSYCPFPLTTAFDWIWWFNFTNKWQHVKYRLLAHNGWTDPKNTFPKIKHFYDTPAWQRWSFDNHDKKIAKSYSTYKLAAKEYIVNSTGFADYINKPKVGSLYQIWYSSEFYEAIDTDYNYLTREQAVEYIR